MRTEEARGQAAAYVWGRQDAGERDTGSSWLFANAYAMRQDAYNTERTWHMIPLQDAWREWHETGRLTYQAAEHAPGGGGWRAIGPDSSPDARIVETALESEPAFHACSYSAGTGFRLTDGRRNRLHGRNPLTSSPFQPKEL